VTDASKPAVLFVCQTNGGKSQMAAGLMRLVAGEEVEISSAGTKAGGSVNELSAEVLLDLGADIRAEHPTQLTEEAVRAAGHVVVLGTNAQVEPVEGVTIERWATDEPSLRGIEGRERMELLRDDILVRVRELRGRLLAAD
jgi:arsenate-mycothiol transferase